MRRGFLLDKSKVKKSAEQETKQESKPEINDVDPIVRPLRYGKVDYDNDLPRPKYNIAIDPVQGTIKSDRKTLILVTVPPRGSAAALNEDEHTEWITFEETKSRIFKTPGLPKPLPKPKGDTPLYEVKMTPNMGMGVFATRDISLGELVFAERPLLVAPINVNVLELSTPPDERYQKILLDEYEKIFEPAFDRMSKGNQTAYKALMNSHTEDGSGLLTGIARTNGYGVSALYDGPGPKATHHAQRYTVIGHVASRINHSCIANVDRSFDMAAFAFVFKAAVDIKAGEQLFISYCEAAASVADRQRELAPYGIVCKCRVCTNATPESDKFRQEYDRRTREYQVRNAALMSGADASWPNDKELNELQQVREMAIKEHLHNRTAYRYILGALFMGYAQRKMFAAAQEVMKLIEQNEAVFVGT
ncbi:SET domain-containing protein [Pholiota conissans]|uniref:SET domain-containing protein n=1 Tax=Pholiota conissans TaxID=109636 RepID=A0A9P5YSN3_9AGAR|nr:SET domain-containing protein [Pholiota conissans]